MTIMQIPKEAFVKPLAHWELDLIARRFAVLGWVFLLSGCLSLNIGPAKPKKSDSVKYVAPPSPFRDFESTNADHAWVNKRNGNSISFLSVCHDPADPSLEMATQDLFNDLSNTQVLKTEHLSFSSREALRSEVKGEIDGVPTQISALVFKKNDCIYTLSYVGVVKAYPEDHIRFETFLSSFEAP